MPRCQFAGWNSITAVKSRKFLAFENLIFVVHNCRRFGCWVRNQIQFMQSKISAGNSIYNSTLLKSWVCSLLSFLWYHSAWTQFSFLFKEKQHERKKNVRIMLFLASSTKKLTRVFEILNFQLVHFCCSWKFTFEATECFESANIGSLC